MYKAWREYVTTTLIETEGHPGIVDPLLAMVQRDLASLDAGNFWGWVIPNLQMALGDTEDLAAPFRTAWGLMYAVTSRLDEVQDNDPTDDPIPGPAVSIQYTLVLAYYVLAQSLLNLLDPSALPSIRVQRLQSLWSDMMLRMASGQYADIYSANLAATSKSLTEYQLIAQTKTGSAFALAFGGVGALMTDDDEQLEALIAVGDIFGLYVQYADDITDAEVQPNATLTLPHMYRAHEALVAQATVQELAAAIYQASFERAQEHLRVFSEGKRQNILNIFQRAFEAKHSTET